PIAAWLTIPDFPRIIAETGYSTLFYTYLFGLLWGIGGLTYGLGVRYLGVSLGSSIILGLCMVFGSLVPSLYYEFVPAAGKDTISLIVGSNWGLTVLLGLVVCIIGIVLCGKAGMMKEKEIKAGEREGNGNGSLPSATLKNLKASKQTVPSGAPAPAAFEEVALASETASAHGAPAGNATEYKFALGLFVSIVSGLLSACFNFGLEAGKPMADVANANWVSANPGQGEFLFRNNVIYIVILWGGLTTNLIWCMILNARNKTFGNYTDSRTPLLKNYLLSALAGTTWFLQFFFYGMGESKLGNGASSWILHMSFIILVANMWGLISKEWAGVSKKTRLMIITGVITIIVAVLVVGYGNYLKPAI
ncbi:MAG TPA: L-rhamnose/proton symporter RhaT, partial [Chitinophagaceae bacterium]